MIVSGVFNKNDRLVLPPKTQLLSGFHGIVPGPVKQTFREKFCT